LDKDSNEAGSPDDGEPVFLTVGKLRKPHGKSGEIGMAVVTDFPDRLVVGKVVYVGEEYEDLVISNIRWHRDLMLIRFDGIETREDAERLMNSNVFVRSDAIPELPQGEYYYHELLGLTVIDEFGDTLGNLVDIIETGANDVYVIRPTHESGDNSEDILLPAIEEVILEIDLINRRMIVKPLEWL
jgi:16S rRNA processing protein RimM